MSKNRFVLGFILGAAVAGVASVALYKNQDSVKAKLIRMKIRADIERRAAKLKELTSEAYEDLVEDILEDYRDGKTISRAELELFKTDLKRNWRELKRRLREMREAKEEGDDDEDDE